MGLAVSKSFGEKITNSTNKTYLGQGNGFKISLYQNKYYYANANKWHAKAYNFYGITNKEVSLSFSTSWDMGGGAKLANKVRENLLTNKILRGLASQNTNGRQGALDPFILTDAWTQKKMTDGAPISVSLSFRSFYENNINSTSYKLILPFLTQICSTPGGLLLLGDAAGNLLRAAGEGFISTLNSITETAKSFGSSMSNSENNEEGVTDTIRNLIGTVSKFVDDRALATGGQGINNGNFTVLLSLGDVIHERSLSTENSVDEQYTKIDWFVKSFNAKPSVSFIMVDDKPMPLWFDIDVSLESRLNLSNRFIYNILNDKPININKN